MLGVSNALSYTGTMYEVINLGNSHTVSLLEMVRFARGGAGRTATINWLAEQPGDVPQTWASVEKARKAPRLRPRTPFQSGVQQFVEWLDQSEGANTTVQASERLERSSAEKLNFTVDPEAEQFATPKFAS